MNYTGELDAEACLSIALVQSEDGEILAGLWWVGVLMSIVSSIASNLGVNVQKLSMLNELKKVAQIENYTEKPYVLQKTWLLGLLLVIAGSIGDFAALGFASQTLATPVGGFTMVANVFFAHFFLHEILSTRDILATCLVVVGVVAVAASADKSEKTYTLECLLKLYQRPVFIGYVVGVIFVVIVLFIITRRLEKMRKEAPDGATYRKYRKLHAICPAALSGVIGAQSVLFAKCSAELIKKSLDGDSQFNDIGTYIILGCMVFTIFNQLHWLAVGLKSFDAVIVIPVFQCFFITGGVIGGGVMFNEFSNLVLWEKMLFTAGVALTIFGVFLLAQREHDKVETKVSPEVNAEGVTIIGGPASTATKGGGDVGSAGGPGSESDSNTERPVTPMPLSLQYHSLAMSDLYTALRDGLTTPEKNLSRRNSSSGRAASPGSKNRSATLPGLKEVHSADETKKTTKQAW